MIRLKVKSRDAFGFTSLLAVLVATSLFYYYVKQPVGSVILRSEEDVSEGGFLKLVDEEFAIGGTQSHTKIFMAEFEKLSAANKKKVLFGGYGSAFLYFMEDAFDEEGAESPSARKFLAEADVFNQKWGQHSSATSETFGASLATMIPPQQLKAYLNVGYDLKKIPRHMWSRILERMSRYSGEDLKVYREVFEPLLVQGGIDVEGELLALQKKSEPPQPQNLPQGNGAVVAEDMEALGKTCLDTMDPLSAEATYFCEGIGPIFKESLPNAIRKKRNFFTREMSLPVCQVGTQAQLSVDKIARGKQRRRKWSGGSFVVIMPKVKSTEVGAPQLEIDGSQSQYFPLFSFVKYARKYCGERFERNQDPKGKALHEAAYDEYESSFEFSIRFSEATGESFQ